MSDRRVRRLIREAREVVCQDEPAEQFLEGVVEILSEHEKISRSRAQRRVRDATVRLINEGYLPKVPRGDQRQKDWVRKAHSVGLFGAALQTEESRPIREGEDMPYMLFDRGSFLYKFFKEKDIPFKLFTVRSGGTTHHIPNYVVVEFIAQTRGSERRKIEQMLRKIDLKNASVNRFLEHLAQAIPEQDFQSMTGH